MNLLPLYLHMEGCATQSEMNANVMASIERGYTRINESLGTESGACAIVGAGPSIRSTYRNLSGDVIAINSAIGFLLGNGVVPKYAMIWDASPLCEAFAVPHKDVTYLIGARCHADVFKRLAGCRVICWHAGGDHNISELLAENRIEEPLVNGGSAGVTRAMFLAVALGYRTLNLYGADSSYSDDGRTHVRGSLVPEKDMHIWIGCDAGARRRFRTTPEWAAQVNEFREIYQMFAHPQVGIDINVYGYGMLPHMARLMSERRKELWNADGTPGPRYARAVNDLPTTPPLEAQQ